LKALILIGGFGTRLRPLSCTRPKVLFPIINKPLLQWTFEKLALAGIDEVILAVNKITEFHIKQHKISKCGLSVKYSYDPHNMPLGTAGPIKKAEKLIGLKEPFLVLNGDLFTNINYVELLHNHIEQKAVATIALYKVDDPSRYGVAELTHNNRITRFIEKPPKGTEPTKLINAGIYVLSPKIFDYIPTGRAVSMEREIFPQLAYDSVFYGHEVEGLWMDIGKPEEYLKTNKLLLDTIAKNNFDNSYEIEKTVNIDKGVSIGNNSVIGPYCILGKNVSVGKNVKIKDSIIFPNVKIEDNVCIYGAIIGEGSKIGKNTQITEGCIIADNVKIMENLSISKKIQICPATEICTCTDINDCK